MAPNSLGVVGRACQVPRVVCSAKVPGGVWVREVCRRSLKCNGVMQRFSTPDQLLWANRQRETAPGGRCGSVAGNVVHHIHRNAVSRRVRRRLNRCRSVRGHSGISLSRPCSPKEVQNGIEGTGEQVGAGTRQSSQQTVHNR